MRHMLCQNGTTVTGCLGRKVWQASVTGSIKFRLIVQERNRVWCANQIKLFVARPAGRDVDVAEVAKVRDRSPILLELWLSRLQDRTSNRATALIVNSG
ncbi:MAG: hypothetical protein JWN70_1338 [Planctomycetaceae bacterium]|nr:hypothetical protein [Planctomycetaceae bacterium]